MMNLKVGQASRLPVSESKRDARGIFCGKTSNAWKRSDPPLSRLESLLHMWGRLSSLPCVAHRRLARQAPRLHHWQKLRRRITKAHQIRTRKTHPEKETPEEVI